MEIEVIQNKIYEIRGCKVMLDFDLAFLYGVENRRFKEFVRRNIGRFPTDFMFELTKIEFQSLRSQIATSNRGGMRYMPFAFTEQGIAMLSSVLNSEKAIEINNSIIHAFVTFRQFTLSYAELKSKIEEIENRFPEIYNTLNYLVDKDNVIENQNDRTTIGYKT